MCIKSSRDPKKVSHFHDVLTMESLHAKKEPIIRHRRRNTKAHVQEPSKPGSTAGN